ncbi:MAG TPA: UDP-2,3-diacylglucosamine diphosphatase [Rhizomicrobium sp.]|jgi:UDP-2,3-diacylglucosamine pyrophosphatase LpxH|nr:UDP-2,3-diacylglucosamine diphosphatase [Rhizomicrobium sp.]
MREQALLRTPFPASGNRRPGGETGHRKRHAAPRENFRSARRYRALFISDVHLGTRGCKAEMLADFLARNSCETLFLVGDIVDGWRLRRRWYWPEAHNRVIAEILHKLDSGTRVVYVPGNHDEMLRPYCGRLISGVELLYETVHETADGRRLLVIHGDRFDAVIAYARWLAYLGDGAYTLALHLNEAFNGLRRIFGLEYWSLSGFLKRKVKNALEYICRFEAAAAREARNRGFDGVICGHIHQAAIKTIEGVLYINDGDWVESCTALAEDTYGHLEILCWSSAAPRPAVVATPIGEFAPAFSA